MFHHAMIAIDLGSHVPLLEYAPDLATWGIGKVTADSVLATIRAVAEAESRKT